MLDIYALKIFLVAAETENFSEAARQLNLTQPAVSMQIRDLERSLKVSLFHRSGRSLSLTEAGRMLIPLARDIVNRAIRLEEEIESLKGEVVGHLKVDCSVTNCKYVLPHLVARFRQRHPKVQITIYDCNRQTAIQELGDGTVQLAVVSSQPPGRDAEYRHFFTDNVVLIVPVSHAWAEQGVIEPECLRQTELILHNPESGTRQDVEVALRKTGLDINDLNVVVEIGSSEAISVAVEDGMGAAFVSRIVAQRGIELGKVKEVQVAGLSLQREVFIAYSRRHPASQARAEFWKFIQETENETLLKLAM